MADKSSLIPFLDNVPVIRRIFSSSNHMLCILVTLYMNYIGVDPEQQATICATLFGISIGGARLEDAAKKRSGGK